MTELIYLSYTAKCYKCDHQFGVEQFNQDKVSCPKCNTLISPFSSIGQSYNYGQVCICGVKYSVKKNNEQPDICPICRAKTSHKAYNGFVKEHPLGKSYVNRRDRAEQTVYNKKRDKLHV